MSQELAGYIMPILLIIVGFMMKNYDFLNLGSAKKYWWVPIVLGVLNIGLNIIHYLVKN